MTPPTKARFPSERLLRKARLASGLVMVTFLALHMSNHALNLISLNAAEKGRLLFLLVWRNPVGTTLLYGAIFIHLSLVLRSLYKRRSLKLPFGETMQILLGLLIPLLIMEHVIGTRIRHELVGYSDTYRSVIHTLWVASPFNGMKQSVALLVAWTHGCIGIYFWLRPRRWFQRTAPLLLSMAILLPVLALLGFANSGRLLASIPVEAASLSGGETTRLSRAIDAASQFQIRLALYGLFGAALALLFMCRAMRSRREWANQIRVTYPSGEIVAVPRGFSILEASRSAGIPHYSICGGKGRCSTCRVRVVKGRDELPEPGSIEQETLHRIGADGDVRLGCQLRPEKDVSVVPLLMPDPDIASEGAAQLTVAGQERDITVLFCDLRSFTQLAETKLPYDVVFLLNRYFAIVGQAVQQVDGRLDKFIGDGAMALFGLRGSSEDGCRNALAAAAQIVRDIERLNEEMADELSLPLRVAIGIHTGPAIVGTMGYDKVKGLTAVGDTVNVASRLESVAKEQQAAIVLSEPVATRAGMPVEDLEAEDIAIRGRSNPLRVYVVSAEQAVLLA
ncbi:adenylate/guanylate cyclase domain-containing protein [Ochrobactrum sp. BD67]